MLIYPENITGLILAGGRGQRVGEQDKGLIVYQNMPLIERQIEWFKKQTTNIFISANRNLEHYQQYHYPVYQDDLLTNQQSYSGPLSGIYTCLKKCQTDWLYIQPVDMPSLPENLLVKLCQSIHSYSPAYSLKSTIRSHYLSMLISKNALPELEKYLSLGNKKVKLFLEFIDAIEIDLGLDEQQFKNLNNLIDY